MPVARLVGESESIFPGDENDKTQKAISGLESLLLEIGAPEEVSQKLYRKALKLNETATPTRGVYAGLVRLLPQLREEIVQELITALASDASKVAGDALRGLAVWLRAVSEEMDGVVLPPTELVREFGLILATRRKAALANALKVAEWIFANGSDEHRNELAPLAAKGLGKLAQELQYGKRQDEEIDVPLLRWRCALLARSMEQRGFDSDQSVIRWRKEAMHDPLPEMRHAGNNYQQKSKSD